MRDSLSQFLLKVKAGDVNNCYTCVLSQKSHICCDLGLKVRTMIGVNQLKIFEAGISIRHTQLANSSARPSLERQRSNLVKRRFVCLVFACVCSLLVLLAPHQSIIHCISIVALSIVYEWYRSIFIDVQQHDEQ
jgi:hypothetical protein